MQANLFEYSWLEHITQYWTCHCFWGIFYNLAIFDFFYFFAKIYYTRRGADLLRKSMGAQWFEQSDFAQHLWFSWIKTLSSSQNRLFHMISRPNYCSDFRYESNGKIVLGVGFFLQTIFDFLTSHSSRNFLKIIRKVLLSWARIWKSISPVILFVK